MFRLVLALVAGLVLAGCSGVEVRDPQTTIESARYAHNGPPEVTLVTVIGTKSGAGGHSALLVNAHERVIYDPAGNYNNGANRGIVPEYDDILFGITPPILQSYYNFHARTEWYVVTQRVEVTPEVADLAYRLSTKQGASASGFCASNTSAVLRNIPGFESIPSTMSPKKLMEEFAKLPGVQTERVYQND
jgi:hypothetical protein